MARQFITSTQIDELAERGETRLEVDDRTTVTDLARERAVERGISVVTVAPATQTVAPAGSVAAVPDATQSVGLDADRLRAAVRSAVLASVGEAPPGLDAAIDQALRAQRGGRS